MGPSLTSDNWCHNVRYLVFRSQKVQLVPRVGKLVGVGGKTLHMGDIEKKLLVGFTKVEEIRMSFSF